MYLLSIVYGDGRVHRYKICAGIADVVLSAFYKFIEVYKDLRNHKCVIYHEN